MNDLENTEIGKKHKEAEKCLEELKILLHNFIKKNDSALPYEIKESLRESFDKILMMTHMFELGLLVASLTAQDPSVAEKFREKYKEKERREKH